MTQPLYLRLHLRAPPVVGIVAAARSLLQSVERGALQGLAGLLVLEPLDGGRRDPIASKPAADLGALAVVLLATR